VIQTIANAFTVPEIRRKIAFTAAMLALYRLGAYIPSPGIDVTRSRTSNRTSAAPTSWLPQPVLRRQPLAALAFRAGDHALHHASIILQLLTVVLPSLEKLQKEGEVGQQKITQYTRYLPSLAFAQGLGYVFLFRSFQNQAGTSVVGTLTFPRSS